MALTCENTDGLDGLSKAHVVAQDPVKAVAVQEGQPVDAFSLVAAQLGLDRDLQRVVVNVLDVHQLLHEPPVS